MNKSGPASTKNVSARLRLTQRAFEAINPRMTQAEVARRAGISKSAWNNALTGDNRLSVNDAVKLFEAFQLDLRWIYLGIAAGLPHDLAKEIEKLQSQ